MQKKFKTILRKLPPIGLVKLIVMTLLCYVVASFILIVDIPVTSSFNQTTLLVYTTLQIGGGTLYLLPSIMVASPKKECTSKGKRVMAVSSFFGGLLLIFSIFQLPQLPRSIHYLHLVVWIGIIVFFIILLLVDTMYKSKHMQY